MAKFFVPDSVADEVHEREIPDDLIRGMRLPLAIAVIHAWDAVGIEGEDFLNNPPVHQEYEKKGGTGILKVNTDRDHWYGIVFNPRSEKVARKEAKKVLKSWNRGEDEADGN